MVEEKIFTIAVSVISTGVLLELVRRLIPSKEKKMDNEQKFQQQLLDMQKEMRDDVHRLENEIIVLRKELDTWRDKYYKLLEDYNKVQAELDDEKNEKLKMQGCIDTLNNQVLKLRTELDQVKQKQV